MRAEVLALIARQFCVGVYKTKILFLLMGLVLVLLAYATYSGVQYHEQNHLRDHHQQVARESWEANPDKHPHRMAHFGTYAFRIKHPLSTFDFGIEHFTGNAVFLEAHRQNVVNFSEASFSTGLIRFGELSLAMILQIIFPLLIFFIGYSAIVADRESGTLKVLLAQGATWKEVIYGRGLGLFTVSSLFYFPFVLVAIGVLALEEQVSMDDWLRLLILVSFYLLYFAVLSLLTMLISASSRSSKGALVKLLGLWLLAVVVIPRTAQSIGSYVHPTPSRLAFRSAIEEEVIQFGDSHNPDDPYYQAIRDSVLAVHKVSSIEELPFNYGGFQMMTGEKISAKIYQKHHNDLLHQYRKQGELTKILALVNPYLGIKNTSMMLCGTDLESYIHFQQQAENYRYHLAQTMNELQMKYIKANVSSSEGRVNVVDRSEWGKMDDFSYAGLSLGSTISGSWLAMASLLVWLLMPVGVIHFWSQKASAL